MIIKTLGHYQITSQLGKGGMGEVYRATDSKLGRDVAIKVLPEEFARDTDRVARFQREAKLLASLNHPNIAAIYGLEESSGTNFLVLELVEGDTLADRIKAGPMPVEESLKLALQIAEALEAAHEKGVIHRDLKPANIKVTPEGTVKVLDFGLAKAFAGEQELNLSNSPTLSMAATQQGIILGTAAYMSPEQAKGKSVDKRADIWAFGAVLFEMLTGQAAFQGEDVTEILAAVVKSGVNLDLLPANIHPRVREVITRCLQKDLKKRYRDIGDVQFELEQVLSTPNAGLLPSLTTVESKKKLRMVLPWVAAAVVLAGLAGWYMKPAPRPEPAQVVSFTYELPEGQQFNVPFPLAISPDGSQFVYGTTGGLYLRSMNGLDARHIAGTDKNSALPFFSPDGRWVGYFSQADRKLKKVAVSGGPPVVICDTAISVSAPRWGKDNSIVYSDVLSGGIMRISAGGGSPECLIKVDRAKAMETGTPDHPQILPDGKTVLLTNSFGDPNIATQILAQSLESGERKVLIKGGNSASYLPTGHLVYVFGIDDIAGISAVPFDIHKLEVTGEPTPVLEGQVMSAVSDSGTLVYIPGRLSARAANQYTLVWVDQKGNEVPIAAPANDYRYPRISPDGTKVATSIFADAKRDIWIWDLIRETPMRLTFDGVSACPLWSPDGNRIAFDSTREKAICWKAANGTGGDEKLGSITGQGLFSPWSWSGDGKTLVTLSRDLATNFDIGAMSMEGDRKWKPLLNQKYDETAVTISPDGHWMAYESNESGQYEIYVRPFPEVNAGKWPISTKGGRAPLWSPDGRKLFYRNGDAAMAVAIEPGPAFKPGKSEVLFRGPYVPRTGQEPHPWDISRDGRFLMMKRVQPTEKAPAAKAPRKISIVVNWFEELKQRVPVK